MIGKPGTYFEALDVDMSVAWDQAFGKMKVYDGMQIGGLRNGALPQHRQISKKDFVDTSMIVKAGTRTTTTDEFATSTNYSTTSGSIPGILPIVVQPGITDVVMLDHPFYAMMPKRATRSKFITWNKRTARGDASFKYEDPGLEPTVDTIGRSVIQIKSAYSVRRITNLNIKASEFFIDIVSEEINSATQALLDLLEDTMITGDASTYAYEFSGLDTLITTNTTDMNGAELTLDNIEDHVRYAKQGSKSAWVGTGRPNLHLTNSVDYQKIKALIRPWLRWNDTNALNWGIESYSIEGRPVIVSPKCNITAGSRRWYVLDMSKWYLGVLQDITYQELPQDADAFKFMLKCYMALTCEDETKNAMLYGIGA